VLGRSRDLGLRGAAGRLFELAVPAALEFKSPRAWAFALLGLEEYLDSFPGDRAALTAADALANRLFIYTAPTTQLGGAGLRGFSLIRMPGCRKLSYDRACVARTKEMIAAGLEALDWLATIHAAK